MFRHGWAKEMLGLEKLSAQEESRLRDLGVNMDMMEAQGAQMAAAQAEEQAAQATAQRHWRCDKHGSARYSGYTALREEYLRKAV
jgi:hypothetical protein